MNKNEINNLIKVWKKNQNIITIILLNGCFNMDVVLKDACLIGHSDLVIWLLNNFPNLNIIRSFINVCCGGQLYIAKLLLDKKPDINISICNEIAFRFACGNGHLEVSKWLLEIKPDINISACNEWAFCDACDNGHLEVVKWLYEIKPTIMISASYKSAFSKACRNGHLEVAKWLQRLKPDKYKLVIENNKIINYNIIN